MTLDHVILVVEDLAAAGAELERRHGLRSVEGGEHPGWGTANRIVPLGDAYVELVAVVDERAAPGNPFGSWVAAAEPGQLLGWVARTDRLDEVASRLGLPVYSGARRTPDGRELRWRSLGFERASVEPSLPFFIEWAAGTTTPGRASVEHPAGAAGLSRLELEGDADSLSSWLGGEKLPVTVSPGRPRVAAAVIATDAGELVIA